MESAIPPRTTSWNRAAWAGLAPPKRAPTKAPGRVTRPVERVWSRFGGRDSRTAFCPMARCARAGVAPGPAGLDLVAPEAGRAQEVAARTGWLRVIALPMMMPAAATT